MSTTTTISIATPTSVVGTVTILAAETGQTLAVETGPLSSPPAAATAGTALRLYPQAAAGAIVGAVTGHTTRNIAAELLIGTGRPRTGLGAVHGATHLGSARQVPSSGFPARA